MSMILYLLLIGTATVALTAMFSLLTAKTAFGRMPYLVRQIIIGVAFGGIAIMNTQTGPVVSGVILTVRDSAPLTAGMCFGGYSGIICGVIGGVWRYFAANLGIGVLSKGIGLFSTIICGIAAAFIYQHILQRRKPGVGFAMLVGVISEIGHLFLFVVDNVTQTEYIYEILSIVSVPMILTVGIVTALSVMADGLISGEFQKRIAEARKKKKHLSAVFERVVFLIMALGVVFCVIVVKRVQTKMAEDSTYDIMIKSLDGIEENYRKSINTTLEDLTIRTFSDIDQLEKLVKGEKNLSEVLINFNSYNYKVYVVNSDGKIIDSTTGDYIGYDTRRDVRFYKILNLYQYGCCLMTNIFPGDEESTYCGLGFGDGSAVIVGGLDRLIKYDFSYNYYSYIGEMTVGDTGYIVGITDGAISVDPLNNGKVSVEVEGVEYTEKNGNDFRMIANQSNIFYSGRLIGVQGMDGSLPPENVSVRGNVFRADAFYCLRQIGSDYLFAVVPASEVYLPSNMSIYSVEYLNIIIFALIFLAVVYLVRKFIIDNLKKVNSYLAEITKGNLDVVVDVKKTREFEELSNDINATVGALKGYIAEEQARNEQELENARRIQCATLPNVFPPFPNHKEFDIYARMRTAKEVGGDFYDFYFVDKENLVFLVADVSGKGIPAALFMMSAKTTIKALAETGLPVEEVITRANNKLCENNDANMFVTAWIGKLNFKTGLLEYANAGHNQPLLYHKGGSFEYLDGKPGLVLAAMEGMAYKTYSVQLGAGDRIVLYTDGITEATRSDNTLYGDDRLRNHLQTCKDKTVDELVLSIMDDVDEFVGEADQFDDMTLLTITYNGIQKK